MIQLIFVLKNRCFFAKMGSYRAVQFSSDCGEGIQPFPNMKVYSMKRVIDDSCDIKTTKIFDLLVFLKASEHDLAWIRPNLNTFSQFIIMTPDPS